MAYMDQAKKKVIAEELKKVVPKGWKYTLSVHNHSSITMSIMSAPIDLIAAIKNLEPGTRDHVQLNDSWLDRAYDGELLKTMEKINKALNTGNSCSDGGDPFADYKHYGFYAHLHIGRWNKKFEVKA